MRRRLAALGRLDRTSLVLGALPVLLALVLLFARLWPEVRALRQEEAALRQRLETLAAYRDRLREHGALERPGAGAVKPLFTGKDPYVVVSSLQEALRDIEGLTVRSFRITSQKDFLGEVRLVGVNFNLQGDVRALVEMLEIIGGFEKALRVKTLTVSRVVQRKRESLQVNLQLEALFRPQGGAG